MDTQAKNVIDLLQRFLISAFNCFHSGSIESEVSSKDVTRDKETASHYNHQM